MAAAAEHELIGQIYHAKQNPDAADECGDGEIYR